MNLLLLFSRIQGVLLTIYLAFYIFITNASPNRSQRTSQCNLTHLLFYATLFCIFSPFMSFKASWRSLSCSSLLISSILNLFTCRYFPTIYWYHPSLSSREFPLSLSFRVHPFQLPSILKFWFIYSLSWSISFNNFLRKNVYEENSQGL